MDSQVAARALGSQVCLADCAVAAARPLNKEAFLLTPSLTELADACAGLELGISAAKGRILQATKHFAVGDLILEEPAAAWVSLSSAPQPELWPGMLQVHPSLSDSALCARFLQLDPHRHTVRAASDPADAAESAATAACGAAAPANFGELVIPVFKRCGHQGLVGSAGGGRGLLLLAVFPVAATANHSCAANADHTMIYSVDAACPVLRVYALRDINVGDEICFNYADFLSHKARRQAMLQSSYGFLCSCSRCAAPHDDTQAMFCAYATGSGKGRKGGTGAGGAACTGAVYVGSAACSHCGKPVIGGVDATARLYSQPKLAAASATSFAQLAELENAFHPCDTFYFERCFALRQAVPTLAGRIAAIGRLQRLAAAPSSHVPLAFKASLSLMLGDALVEDGQGSAAAVAYSAAATFFATIYGPSHPLTAVVLQQSASPPSTAAEIPTAQSKRKAAQDWRQLGLPLDIMLRWLAKPAAPRTAEEES